MAAGHRDTSGSWVQMRFLLEMSEGSISRCHWSHWQRGHSTRPQLLQAQPTPAWLNTSTVSQSWHCTCLRGLDCWRARSQHCLLQDETGQEGMGQEVPCGQQDGGVGLGCSRNRSPGMAATFQTGAPTNVGTDWSLQETGAPVCAGGEGAAQPRHGCLPRAQEPWSPLSPLLATELLQNLQAQDLSTSGHSCNGTSSILGDVSPLQLHW